MRLAGVAVKDFQSIADLRVDFRATRAVTLVLGPNNAGKTSLARAVEVAVRGESSVFRGKAGMPLADLIRTGAKRAEISADILRTGADKATAVMRTVGPKGISTAVNGARVAKDVFDFYCPAGLLNPSAVLNICCNVSGFFDLPPDRQKATLEGLIDQSVPPEALAGLPWEQDLSELPKTLADVDAAYQVVYGTRRAVKSDLDGMRVVAEPAGDAPDVPAIEAKLTALRTEERALIAVVGEKAGRRNAMIAARVDLLHEVEIRRAEMAQFGGDDVLAAALREAKATAEEMTALALKGRAVAERSGVIREWDKRLGALKASCVISEEVRCPLESPERKAIRAKWAAELEAISAEWAGGPTAKDVKAAEDGLRAAEAAVAGKKRKAERLEESFAALKRADAELEATPPDADRAPLDALRGRIQRGESNLAEARLIVEQRGAWERHGANRRAAEARLADLEALCRAFGAKGVRERLLAERLGALLSRLNGILSGFGVTVGLESEPWAVTLNGVPADLAAASERFRAGVAFQVAIAQATGVGFAVVDGADILDGRNRAALFDTLASAVKAGLEQVVVTATMQNGVPAGPFPEWMQVLVLGGGPEGTTVSEATPA